MYKGSPYKNQLCNKRTGLITPDIIPIDPKHFSSFFGEYNIQRRQLGLLLASCEIASKIAHSFLIAVFISSPNLVSMGVYFILLCLTYLGQRC